VAGVSDLTVSWVLLAIFVALPATMQFDQDLPDSSPQLTPGQRLRRSHPTPRGRSDEGHIMWRLALVACLIVGIGVLTWVKTINYPWAAVKAREGVELIVGGDLEGALLSLDRAVDLAPDISVYHNLRAIVYSAYRDKKDFPREPECGLLGDVVHYDQCLARKAYFSNREGATQRAFDGRSHIALGESALTLALLERDAGLASDAIRFHREAADLDPHNWSRLEGLAAAYIRVGQPWAALGPLEESLAMLRGTPRSGYSRLLQGLAYLDLGQPRTALESFDEAIRLYPEYFDAYTNRGAVYNTLGQYQQAIRDLDKAIQLKPRVALAYNNRGNAYGDLNQLHRAIQDYDEAIRLDPQFALAYSNRALAYTYLGRDTESRQDVARAAELGLDPTSLLEQIEELKKSR